MTTPTMEQTAHHAHAFTRGAAQEYLTFTLVLEEYGVDSRAPFFMGRSRAQCKDRSHREEA
jgi:hypothetical protein